MLIMCYKHLYIFYKWRNNMAERLTKKINKIIQNKYSLGQYLYYDFAGLNDTNKLLNKLGKLEDILEKYDLEVEELDERIYNGAFNYIDKLKAETDRDTWERACELACETLKQVMGKPLWIGGNIPTPEVKDSDYFYQQAKKESENYDTNN